MMNKVAVTINEIDMDFSSQLNPLQELGFCVDFIPLHHTTNSSYVGEKIKGYDYCIAGSESWDKTSLSAVAETMKMIIRFGAGYENINLDVAEKLGIAVAFAPGKNAKAVAEHCLGMLLCMVREILQYDKSVKSGNYKSHLTNSLKGTIGLLGFGAIGKELAKLLQPFPVNIIAYDIFHDEKTASGLGVKFVSMEQLQAESDFLSVHIPRNSGTIGLINSEFISKMKDRAYIINTSRGGIIDEKALYNSLKSGKLLGAALDVFKTEPIEQDNLLLTLENTILTPHTASASIAAYYSVMEYCAACIRDFHLGNNVDSILNPGYKNYTV